MTGPATTSQALARQGISHRPGRVEYSGQPAGRWLFSAPVDMAAFLGSAVLALLLLPVGAALGVLHGDAPEWTWIAAVLLIDVAHVWSTIFRVYLDRAEFLRRRGLYILAPACAYLMGVALYSESPGLFWRVLAYMAVFHFIRQQYGWVVLYRARTGERAWALFDAAVIYAATVYPVLYWHAHLPRAFAWFLPGDFAGGVPFLATAARVMEPVYWALLAAYVARSAHTWVSYARSNATPGNQSPSKPARWLMPGVFNPGKDIVVLTTAACWYTGIVACNSDYAFTVTNVIIHGVPYFVLIYWYGRRRTGGQSGNQAGALSHHGPDSQSGVLPASHSGARADLAAAVFQRGPWLFVLVVWALAFAEECLWDRAVWHERAWLFGVPWDAESVLPWLVPLLAVPQATHYILDGFIWRRRQNPDFQRAGAFTYT